jgi:hypothetical protein
MSANQPTRRSVIVTSAAAAGLSQLPEHLAAEPDALKEVRPMTDAIGPFGINVLDEALVGLRCRIRATRSPERDAFTGESQGAQPATIDELGRYWGTDYDWRKVEARLNALPQFINEIDGVDIHFIHVRPKHDHVLPLIVTHGWPRSVIEQLKTIDPLTNPTAHGGSASDAFHLVIPEFVSTLTQLHPTQRPTDRSRRIPVS